MFQSNKMKTLPELEKRQLINKLSAFSVVASYLKNFDAESLGDLSTTDNILRNEYTYTDNHANRLSTKTDDDSYSPTPVFINPNYLFVGTQPVAMTDPEGRVVKVCVVVTSKTNDTLVDKDITRSGVSYGEFNIYGVVSHRNSSDRGLDYEEVVEIYTLNDLASHGLYHVMLHPAVPFKNRLVLLNNLLDKMLEVELKHNTREVGGECYSRKLVAMFNVGDTVIPYSLCDSKNTESIRHDAVASIFNNLLRKNRG